ncbi:hypothetical protein TNIN_171211 [Trichonephila inaurata madagascariensis]|uniref:Uncharacterized protein n=1 Tax=Trichonephila inaurata madagascariensis TaxID=2747483 RepID=A0A8X7CTU1_9ARAC|nr:hypothetical protein TNIN_171211 [Trichonephila inaurata madagascariensis]
MRVIGVGCENKTETRDWVLNDSLKRPCGPAFWKNRYSVSFLFRVEEKDAIVPEMQINTENSRMENITCAIKRPLFQKLNKTIPFYSFQKQ